MSKHRLINPLDCFSKKPRQEPKSGSTATVDEVIHSLNVVLDSNDLNQFVHIIKRQLEDKRNSHRGSTSRSAKEDKANTSQIAEDNRGKWTSIITSGAKFLKFVNYHTEKMEDKKDLYSGNSTVVAEILGQIGQLHWAVGGLAVAAYLIEKVEKVSANKAEAFKLLSNMVDLATTVVKLRDVIPEEEERSKKAVMLVVQGSIMCVSQIHSENIFSFLRTSVNSKNLKDMSERLNQIYRDLDLAVSAESAVLQKEMRKHQSMVREDMAKRQSMLGEDIAKLRSELERHDSDMRERNQSEMAKRLSEMAKHQSEVAKRQSIVLPVPKPFYPKDAVGIDNAREEVTRLLNMTTEDVYSVVVVIYGFGGIGKTTLANAVVAKLNLDKYLDRYNYVRVYLDEDKSKNNFKKLQQTILKDGFPTFHSGVKIGLRDCQEGRDRLNEAFMCPENKPLFLFIDNALRSQDLKELLPENLSGLPKGSIIFLTTRRLDQTDVFLPLERRAFAIKTLEDDHALKILCNDPDNHELIKHDMRRILRICGGVPLVLKIVGAQLFKMGYNASRCRNILDTLEKGGFVKEENLSQRLVHFVYNELEQSPKDAFLDTCWFCSGWLRRHVEYVVGEYEVQLLVEAALVTPYVDYDDIRSIYHGEERLRVHDIVKATGRSISASTRFTDAESFSEAAQDETKLNGIKGLDFRDSSSAYVVDVQHLNSMRHSLRFLALGEKKMRTSAQSAMNFNQLRFLQVGDHIPHLPMKVEELDTLVCYVGPIGLRGMMDMNKLPKTLCYMVVTSLPSQIETFATSGVHNHSLQELILHGGNIKQFPEGLHQLRSLKILYLLGYNDMEEFPEQVRELSSLNKLCILWWNRLKRLPESFGGLKGLTHLELSFCNELEELPSSFGELTALEYLNLAFCKKLKELPRGLDSLKYLYVRRCEQLSVESYQNKPGLTIDRL